MVSTRNKTHWSLESMAFFVILTTGSTCNVEVTHESNKNCTMPCKQELSTDPSSVYVRWFKSMRIDEDCSQCEWDFERPLVTWTGRKVVVNEDGYDMDESSFSLIIVKGTLTEKVGLFRCDVTTRERDAQRSHFEVKTKLAETVDEGSNTVTTPAMEAAYTSRDPHTQSRPPTLSETENHPPTTNTNRHPWSRESNTQMVIFEVFSAFVLMAAVIALSLYLGKKCAKKRDGGAPNKLLTVSNVPEKKAELFNSERRSMIDDQRRKHLDNTSELCSAGAEVRSLDCTFVSETEFHKFSVASGC